MNDPYSVLGISRGATDDEIKKAYRALSRKYHPDANINNPNKDQAEAKFKEVQQAYQQIMHEREYGTTGSYGNGYGSSSGGYDGNNPNGGYGDFGGFDFGGFDFGGFGNFRGYSGQYQQRRSGATSNEGNLHMQAAANFINNGRYQEAINVLSGIDNKTAQWYYYSAIANSGIGNNVIALQHAREAARMEPNNIQYTTLVQRLENGGNWYRQQQGPYQTTFSSSGDWCVKLCIANLVCNLCCGGSGLCCGGNGMNGGHYI